MSDLLQMIARTYYHPNSPCLASSHVAFRQRQTRASRFVHNEQLTNKEAAIAQEHSFLSDH